MDFFGHLVLNLGPAIGDLYVVEGKFQQGAAAAGGGAGFVSGGFGVIMSEKLKVLSFIRTALTKKTVKF